MAAVAYPIPPGGTPIPGRDFRLGEASTGDDYQRMPGLCADCGQRLDQPIVGHLPQIEQPPAALPTDQPQEQAA